MQALRRPGASWVGCWACVCLRCSSEPLEHLCPHPSEARMSPFCPPSFFICRCMEGWFTTLFKESNSGCVSLRILFSVSPDFTLFYLVCSLLISLAHSTLVSQILELKLQIVFTLPCFLANIFKAINSPVSAALAQSTGFACTVLFTVTF